VDPKANIAGLLKFEKPGTRTPPGQPEAKQPDAKQPDSKPAGAAAGGASPSSTQR
jgi:hypothetical protein